MANPMKGRVAVTRHAAASVHTYVSPADGFGVATQIVEGPSRLVVFDGQLLKPYAEEVAGYIASLDKPVDRIILSHGHPDHWSGLEVLSAWFPQAPVLALAGVAEQIQAQGDVMLAGLRKAFGDLVASRPMVPQVVLAEGPQVIDGIRFDFRRVLDAEADLQLLALMPDQHTMLAFDLMFAPSDHVFTVTPHFDHWIGLLRQLRDLGGHAHVHIGHGMPVDATSFDATIAYLQGAKAAYEQSPDGAAYAAALKAAFPHRQQAGWADFSGRVLYLRRQASAQVVTPAAAP